MGSSRDQPPDLGAASSCRVASLTYNTLRGSYWATHLRHWILHCPEKEAAVPELGTNAVPLPLTLSLKASSKNIVGHTCVNDERAARTRDEVNITDPIGRDRAQAG
jgi:hypothetical protein